MLIPLGALDPVSPVGRHRENLYRMEDRDLVSPSKLLCATADLWQGKS